MGDRGETREITVAVMGQPNVGKSTLFNILTGRNIHVANWPGVTVEKHEGWRLYRGYSIHFVDLPGIYGLSASTLEEVIARNYLLSGKPDVVLVLVDSTIPERTMYLLIEVLELFPKTIIVFTKADLAHAHGVHINPSILSHRLGVPVVMVSSVTGLGFYELLDTIVKVYEGRVGRRDVLRVDYGELEAFIDGVVEAVEGSEVSKQYPVRWVSVRLLEGDSELLEKVRACCGEDVVRKVLGIRDEVIRIFHRRPEELFALKRFNYLNNLLSKAVVRVGRLGIHRFFDKLFLNTLYGPFISLAFLLLVFIIVFTLNTGFPLNIVFESMGLSELACFLEDYSLGSLMEYAIGFLGDLVGSAVPGNQEWLHSLVVDGVIGGVGAVLAFLPLIFLVSLFLAILEDSGIAPRIAVSLHILFKRIGLSGHAVFPIVLSLGCNVPGVIATRATPSFRERLRLITTLAFIPCQARLVVVLAFASAIRGVYGLAIVLLAYLVSFTVFAIINKLLLVYDVRRGYSEEPELLLELPPVHKPLPKVVWWLTWDSTKHFLKKAGSIIFLLSIIVWFLLYYTPALEPASSPSESIGALLASVFSPLLYPLGLDSRQAWMMTFALMVGFIAKEAVIGTLSIISGEEDMATALRGVIGLNDAQIASLTLFTILYVPCLATIAVVYMESRSWKTTLAVIALMMATAYIVSVLAYLISIAFT